MTCFSLVKFAPRTQPQALRFLASVVLVLNKMVLVLVIVLVVESFVREYHRSHPADATHFGSIHLGLELLPNSIGHAFEVNVFG